MSRLDQGWIWESRLPTRLGLSRDDLRALRKALLTEGADYVRHQNRLLISPAGLEKMRAHLDQRDAGPTDSPGRGSANGPAVPTAEKNAAPGKAEERLEPSQEILETLLVWRCNLPNRRIIEAYKKGADPQRHENILRVKVHDADRFTRFDNMGQPLEVQVRHIQADYYEHVGAAPRRKGYR